MNETGLKAIGHRIIVKIDKDKEAKVGKVGIILPKSASKQRLEQFISGTVIDIGLTAFDYLTKEGIKMPILIGQRIIIKKHAGIETTDFGGYEPEEKPKYRIVNDEDIMAAFEDDKLKKEV